MDMGNRDNKNYYRLAVMAVLSFVCMYGLMYAMADRFINVYFSLNQFYMAGLMTIPMVLIEMLLMRNMYGNKKLNAVIIASGSVALIVFFALIRQQLFIDDRQFLRSMIPHHAGALLMCEKAAIRDNEIKSLCEGIKAGQQSEIDRMKSILDRLKD